MELNQIYENLKQNGRAALVFHHPASVLIKFVKEQSGIPQEITGMDAFVYNNLLNNVNLPDVWINELNKAGFRVVASKLINDGLEMPLCFAVNLEKNKNHSDSRHRNDFNRESSKSRSENGATAVSNGRDGGRIWNELKPQDTGKIEILGNSVIIYAKKAIESLNRFNRIADGLKERGNFEFGARGALAKVKIGDQALYAVKEIKIPQDVLLIEKNQVIKLDTERFEAHNIKGGVLNGFDFMAGEGFGYFSSQYRKKFEANPTLLIHSHINNGLSAIRDAQVYILQGIELFGIRIKEETKVYPVELITAKTQEELLNEYNKTILTVKDEEEADKYLIKTFRLDDQKYYKEIEQKRETVPDSKKIKEIISQIKGKLPAGYNDGGIAFPLLDGGRQEKTPKAESVSTRRLSQGIVSQITPAGSLILLPEIRKALLSPAEGSMLLSLDYLLIFTRAPPAAVVVIALVSRVINTPLCISSLLSSRGVLNLSKSDETISNKGLPVCRQGRFHPLLNQRRVRNDTTGYILRLSNLIPALFNNKFLTHSQSDSPWVIINVWNVDIYRDGGAASGKRPICEDTWSPDLDIVLPIDATEIQGFSNWVNQDGYTAEDYGFNFIAYINQEGKRILGLSAETKVRAITDGTVVEVDGPYGHYFIKIEHASKYSGMFSVYHNVRPKVNEGQNVKKGQVIGTLFKKDGDENSRLVSLHFALSNGWGVRPRNVNPVHIFPDNLPWGEFMTPAENRLSSLEELKNKVTAIKNSVFSVGPKISNEELAAFMAAHSLLSFNTKSWHEFELKVLRYEKHVDRVIKTGETTIRIDGKKVQGIRTFRKPSDARDDSVFIHTHDSKCDGVFASEEDFTTARENRNNYYLWNGLLLQYYKSSNSNDSNLGKIVINDTEVKTWSFKGGWNGILMAIISDYIFENIKNINKFVLTAGNGYTIVFNRKNLTLLDLLNRATDITREFDSRALISGDIEEKKDGGSGIQEYLKAAIGQTGGAAKGLLFTKESKQDTDERANLAYPKNKHPADNAGFNLSKAFFETFLNQFNNIFFRMLFGFIDYINQSLSAFGGKFILKNSRNGYNCHFCLLLHISIIAGTYFVNRILLLFTLYHASRSAPQDAAPSRPARLDGGRDNVSRDGGVKKMEPQQELMQVYDKFVEETSTIPGVHDLAEVLGWDAARVSDILEKIIIRGHKERVKIFHLSLPQYSLSNPISINFFKAGLEKRIEIARKDKIKDSVGQKDTYILDKFIRHYGEWMVIDGRQDRYMLNLISMAEKLEEKGSFSLFVRDGRIKIEEHSNEAEPRILEDTALGLEAGAGLPKHALESLTELLESFNNQRALQGLPLLSREKIPSAIIMKLCQKHPNDCGAVRKEKLADGGSVADPKKTAENPEYMDGRDIAYLKKINTALELTPKERQIAAIELNIVRICLKSGTRGRKEGKELKRDLLAYAKSDFSLVSEAFVDLERNKYSEIFGDEEVKKKFYALKEEIRKLGVSYAILEIYTAFKSLESKDEVISKIKDIFMRFPKIKLLIPRKIECSADVISGALEGISDEDFRSLKEAKNLYFFKTILLPLVKTFRLWKCPKIDIGAVTLPLEENGPKFLTIASEPNLKNAPQLESILPQAQRKPEPHKPKIIKGKASPDKMKTNVEEEVKPIESGKEGLEKQAEEALKKRGIPLEYLQTVEAARRIISKPLNPEEKNLFGLEISEFINPQTGLERKNRIGYWLLIAAMLSPNKFKEILASTDYKEAVRAFLGMLAGSPQSKFFEIIKVLIENQKEIIVINVNGSNNIISAEAAIAGLVKNSLTFILNNKDGDIVLAVNKVSCGESSGEELSQAERGGSIADGGKEVDALNDPREEAQKLAFEALYDYTEQSVEWGVILRVTAKENYWFSSEILKAYNALKGYEENRLNKFLVLIENIRTKEEYEKELEKILSLKVIMKNIGVKKELYGVLKRVREEHPDWYSDNIIQRLREFGVNFPLFKEWDDFEIIEIFGEEKYNSLKRYGLLSVYKEASGRMEEQEVKNWLALQQNIRNIRNLDKIFVIDNLRSLDREDIKKLIIENNGEVFLFVHLKVFKDNRLRNKEYLDLIKHVFESSRTPIFVFAEGYRGRVMKNIEKIANLNINVLVILIPT